MAYWSYRKPHFDQGRCGELEKHGRVSTRQRGYFLGRDVASHKRDVNGYSSNAMRDYVYFRGFPVELNDLVDSCRNMKHIELV